ncbi:MAG: radical SAM protein, partial [Elusimicrobiota bacterium]
MARLLFLQDTLFEFLGPMYISAMAKSRGHEARLALGSRFEDLSPAIESFRPDLLGFSVMTGSHDWALDMAREARARFGVASIFGGPHPTLCPDFLDEDGVDMIVRGEGEQAVVEVLAALSKGQDLAGIANLGHKSRGVTRLNQTTPPPDSLDELPWPDRDLYNGLGKLRDRTVASVLTSRGCPYSCTFCSAQAMRKLYGGKAKVRFRSPSDVVRECRDLRDRRRAKTIYFTDDIFGLDRAWLAEFLPLYRTEVGLRFICLMRPDLLASDQGLAKRLAQAGCVSVFFGIESGDERLRNQVLGKAVTDSAIRLAASSLRQAAIKFRTYNIMGFPGDSLGSALKTIRLNIEIKTDHPWCSIFS